MGVIRPICETPAILMIPLLKPESYHDANVVITAAASDDKVGIMATFGFQCRKR